MTEIDQMNNQVNFSYALQDWQICSRYLDLVSGKTEYDPGNECSMACFIKDEIVEYEKQMYKIEIMVCSNESIWIKVYEQFENNGRIIFLESKCKTKYYSSFQNFDEVGFHIRFSSLKINPLI
jgi:hypothetical protein